MKIRSGFVSNSSSSSFLIYGVHLDRGDLVSLLQNSDEKIKDYDGEVIDPSDLEEMDFWELGEYLPVSVGSDISIERPSGSDLIYVGVSWHLVRDDETGKQFKDRVSEGLKKMGLDVEKRKLGTHSEAWHG